MKVGTQSTLNMLNSIIRIILDQKDPFWAILFQTLKTAYLFKMKLGTKIKLNKLNLMLTFIFSALDWKYPLWTNLVQKNQIRLLKMNHGIQTDWNMLNSIVIFNIYISVNQFSFWTTLDNLL